MSPVALVLAAAFLGAVLGYAACYLDLTAWLLACYASLLNAQWYSPRLHCPRCGHMRHLMRHHGDREGTWGTADAGLRCLGCSGKTPRNAPGNAPERTESAEGVGLSVLGWPQASQGAPRDAQDRDNERSER